MNDGFVLMHKDVPVARLSVDSLRGILISIDETVDIEHAPSGVIVDGTISYRKLNEWWESRTIPSGRNGLHNMLDVLDIPSPNYLLAHSMGLGLSDHYWIKPADSDISYSDINYFQNEFSGDIGELLFGNTRIDGSLDCSSPDLTTDGNLMKKWKIINGKRCLLKTGTGMNQQEVFNEVIASILMGSLGIDHTEYTVCREHSRMVSCCEDFVGMNTELVPAKSLIDISKGDEYRQYVTVCANLGIDIVPALDRMMAVDYLIGNEDRHLGNFGLLRNPDTLEYLGPAPVYDCGSSLGYDRMTYGLNADMVLQCKPFAGSHEQQLSLVRDYSWINEEALSDGLDKVDVFFEENRKYLGERLEPIRAFLHKRADLLLAHL